MATNNLASIPGFDALLPGGWTGTQNLTNRWGDVQTNGDGSLTLTSTDADAVAMQSGAGNGYGLYSFDLSSRAVQRCAVARGESLAPQVGARTAPAG